LQRYDAGKSFNLSDPHMIDEEERRKSSVSPRGERGKRRALISPDKRKKVLLRHLGKEARGPSRCPKLKNRKRGQYVGGPELPTKKVGSLLHNKLERGRQAEKR